jgi:ATP-dependent Clp protease ATP-binding subunit ClpB
MNLNNFTIKAQESVQQAFNIVEAKGQQSVESAHILKGVMVEAENITGFLFGKLGVNSGEIMKETDRYLPKGIRCRIIFVINSIGGHSQGE